MLNLIQNTSISFRIALLGLLPMLALLTISANNLYLYHVQAEEARLVERMVRLTPAISNLVHELQKERGTSAGFLSSKGKSFSSEISPRRTDTDKALKLYEAEILKAENLIKYDAFSEPFNRAKAVLSQLQSTRTSIDQFSIKVSDMAGYYTPLITDLLSMIESVSFQINNAEIMRSFQAYTSLLQAKERAGLERAMGAAGFGTASFSKDVHKKFIRFGAMQDIFLKEVHKYANEDQRLGLRKLLTGKEKELLEKLRSLAIGAPHGVNISGVSGAQWFQTSTRMIDLLKEFEERFIKDLLFEAASKLNLATNTFWTVLILLLALFITIAGIYYSVVKSIVPPLKRLVENMKRLAGHDTSFDISDSARQDEIGDMARAVVIFRENAIERKLLEEETQKEQLLREERQEKVEQLISDFRSQSQSSMQSFASNASQMQNLAVTLDNIANLTSNRTETTTIATNQASGSVQSVASTTEQMACSIAEISQQVSKANELVRDATHDAEDSNSKISNLAEAADKIGNVIALIQDIAEQTNLLALNATIEAARAGESGKGFAVVASEVKELASQTAKATEEISEQVSGIQSETQDSVQAIKSIALKMGDVSEFTGSIAKAIEEQGAAITEISSSIQEAAKSTEEVVNNINEVAGSVQDTKTSVSQVVDASSNMSGESESVTRVIDQFLDKVSRA